jgi:SAM-dependent methyltransferase
VTHSAEDAARVFRERRRAQWEANARRPESRLAWSGGYHRRLTDIYRNLVPPGTSVLELGCGRGDLLASLQPSRGVGVDFSPEMIRQARARHPRLEFVEADVHDLRLGETFDVVILSDIVNDLWDLQAVFERVAAHASPGTRVLLNLYSRVWGLPLAFAQALGLANRLLPQNWLTREDVSHLLHLSGFEVIRETQEILLPLAIPGLGGFANKLLAHLWPFRLLDLTNVVVARPVSPANRASATVSVVVPARNEAGNIAAILDRTPRIGAGTELIFVEGHSADDTAQTIEREIAARPGVRARLLRQSGRGKGDAVREGFAAATGDVLMILDADLAVPPEDLPRFYEALHSGKGDFINGVRLVYPMEDRAMRFLNFLGNKFFGLAFSWLLGQPIKDTLCGTKVLWRRDYDVIARNRSHFGEFDPFGDFDLLFGAARLNLRLVDLPVRYRERTYGTTNISRFRHGWLLLKMLAFAATRLKFV